MPELFGKKLGGALESVLWETSFKNSATPPSPALYLNLTAIWWRCRFRKWYIIVTGVGLSFLFYPDPEAQKHMDHPDPQHCLFSDSWYSEGIQNLYWKYFCMVKWRRGSLLYYWSGEGWCGTVRTAAVKNTCRVTYQRSPLSTCTVGHGIKGQFVYLELWKLTPTLGTLISGANFFFWFKFSSV